MPENAVILIDARVALRQPTNRLQAAAIIATSDCTEGATVRVGRWQTHHQLTKHVRRRLLFGKCLTIDSRTMIRIMRPPDLSNVGL